MFYQRSVPVLHIMPTCSGIAVIFPKLQYLPDGPIFLGNVIADALSPHRPIMKLAENERLQVAEFTARFSRLRDMRSYGLS